MADVSEAPCLMRVSSATFFWLLLIAGMAGRLIDAGRPLLDAHNIRQTHTAVLTQSLIETGFPLLKAQGNWQGFENTTVLLEFPLMNHLAGRLAQLTGHLEASGRCVAVGFWGLACILLHRLVRATFDDKIALGTTTLFVVSPLSIFFGQAFQPESLVLFLSLLILYSWLKTLQTGSHSWFLIFLITLGFSVILKFNEIVHLGVPILATAILHWKKTAWRQPRLWIAALLLALILAAWSHLISEVNRTSSPHWTAGANLASFIGTWTQRTSPEFYLKLISYMVFLGITPMLLPFLILGIRKILKMRDVLWISWGAGILLYELVFGPGGPGAHSYYHLNVLPWFCIMTALGIRDARSGPRIRQSVWIHCGAILLWILGVIIGCAVLFHPDRTAFEAALELKKAGASSRELALIAADHRKSTSGFPMYPTILFYANLKGYNLPARDRKEFVGQHLQKHPEIKWAVQTHYEESADFPTRHMWPYFSQQPPKVVSLDEILAGTGFQKISSSATVTLYHRP